MQDADAYGRCRETQHCRIDLLLQPFSSIGNLLHIADDRHNSSQWLHSLNASTRHRISCASNISNVLLDATVYDVVVDDCNEHDSVREHVKELWSVVKPSGTFLFRMAASEDAPPSHLVHDVRAWISTLAERMTLGGGFLHHHYMGSLTASHRAAAAESRRRAPLPHMTSMIFCEMGGCALTKVGECDCAPGKDLVACSHRHDKMSCEASRRGADTRSLGRVALAQHPVCDKIGTAGYTSMYGALITPLARAAASAAGRFKLLEIGLGCDQSYGPGASVKLWQKHFPKELELWEGEYDEACVQKARARGQLQGVNTVTGDQGNLTVLRRWLNETQGSFDAVIDDGGHRNSLIAASFEELWPAVAPNGIYFIEDMHVGRTSHYEDTFGRTIIADAVRNWLPQLMAIDTSGNATGSRAGFHKLPRGTAFILCSGRSCAVGKRGHRKE